MEKTLLEIQNLKKEFPVQSGFLARSRGTVHAVDGVNLKIYKGETLGLVGESGCGKTTLGRVIARIENPTEGKIIFDGENILDYSGPRLKAFRKRVQLIFQDPYTSLNPRKSAGAIVGEPLYIHNTANGKEAQEKIAQLLAVVGLSREHMNRYPHEFSGGQRQRIGIARALALNPDLIIADEPVSALDVSIQAQILNLLKDLQRDFDLTYLFISHDLSVIGHMSDRIAVMYLGKIVEIAESRNIFEKALHPYTEVLLSAVPAKTSGSKTERIIPSGDVPSPIDPPPGCFFHPRCSYRMDICSKEEPELVAKSDNHFAACHLRK